MSMNPLTSSKVAAYAMMIAVLAMASMSTVLGTTVSPAYADDLTIKKFVKLDDKGITVNETVSFLKKAHIVEATLKDPKHNLYVYKNIPLPVPAHIPWDDRAWEPLVKLFDGKWELKLQIIAVYEDPKTKELKQVEQKIIIHFTVVKGMISVFHDDPTQPPPPLELNKLIKVTPHPAQLNGKINIEIGEKVMPKARDVFVTEVTLAKPSGTVVSYTKLPVHITVGNANIPFPGPDWSAGGFNPTIALDELGMWELDIEIIAFYYDGTTEIRKINQKLWISFNVIPEHILPMLAVIAPLGVLALYMYRKKHEMYSNTGYNL
ncbi:MAG: hypothetical protein NZ888_02920 [Candidatus Nitrosocaldus sp.]|nr:hypothetical protein [Candidatus Nitrosocaldus sp.]MDW8000085.1 hypothetical protein [Candidatus Nitrosocaldus sp.]